MKKMVVKYIVPIYSKIILVYIKIKNPKIKLTVGKNIIINHRIKIKGEGIIILEDNVKLWAHQEYNQLITYNKESIIKIGENTMLNGSNIHCRKKVEIGKNCKIGSSTILDNDQHNHLEPKGAIPKKDIIIGDNVWIGGQTAILKGVTIGENSIVGFRAVVSKSFPDNALIVGNPGVNKKK